jgi:hypothetical protein
MSNRDVILIVLGLLLGVLASILPQLMHMTCIWVR